MPNRLRGEASPYLKQHADNPVDWYPWGAEALERAVREDKPILLSVGYAACHWCHVMANESFVDEATAALMNRLFINIKVDREERPDLDHIYQRAHQMLTGEAGGWPLTMFLFPDQMPFFSGTYFPKTARYGRIAFTDLLARLDEAYQHQRPALAQQNATLREHLARTPASGSTAESTADTQNLTAVACKALLSQADETHGGIGAAPKFPHPVEIGFLFRHGGEAGRKAALAAARSMALGGLQDQAGGGFYRYCVDADWQIPHFEKMLYDNALLLPLYAEAAQSHDKTLFTAAANGIVNWLEREMRAPSPDETAYCASLDADSEHEEGAFYVWTREAAQRVLSEAEWQVAETAFGFDRPANFENVAWHLRRPLDDTALAERLGLTETALAESLAGIAEKLLHARSARVRPGRDDKQVTSWNALMLAGLAKAGRLLGEPGWVSLAQAGLDTLRNEVWGAGRLRAIRQHGENRLNAYLDDHAFLLDALIESLQAEWRDTDLEFAQAVAAVLLERFQDEDGSLWMVSHDHENLITRPRDIHDHATPSGAAVATGALATLSAIDGNPRWRAAAEAALAAHFPEATSYPAAACSLWQAAIRLQEGPALVRVRGDADALATWRAFLSEALPRAVLCVYVPAPESDSANAALCAAQQCLPTVTSPAELLAQFAALPTATPR